MHRGPRAQVGPRPAGASRERPGAAVLWIEGAPANEEEGDELKRRWEIVMVVEVMMMVVVVMLIWW